MDYPVITLFIFPRCRSGNVVSGGLLRRGPEIINAFIHEPGQVGEALVSIIEMLRQRRVLVVNAFVNRGIHVIDSFIHVIKAFIDIGAEPGE